MKQFVAIICQLFRGTERAKKANHYLYRIPVIGSAGNLFKSVFLELYSPYSCANKKCKSQEQYTPQFEVHRFILYVMSVSEDF